MSPVGHPAGQRLCDEQNRWRGNRDRDGVRSLGRVHAISATAISSTGQIQ